MKSICLLMLTAVVLDEPVSSFAQGNVPMYEKIDTLFRSGKLPDASKVVGTVFEGSCYVGNDRLTQSTVQGTDRFYQAKLYLQNMPNDEGPLGPPTRLKVFFATAEKAEFESWIQKRLDEILGREDILHYDGDDACSGSNSINFGSCSGINGFRWGELRYNGSYLIYKGWSMNSYFERDRTQEPDFRCYFYKPLYPAKAP